METRKVQRLGPSTLAITLPAEWTSAYAVDKGDELTVHEGKGSLIVTAEPSAKAESEAVICVRKLEASAVERAIIAQYVLGRRVIQIEQREEALSGDIIDAIYRAESQLMGLGVVEETPDRISVRCSVDPGDFEVENLLERLERTGRTMRGEAVNALVRNNATLAQRAVNRERQANKIFVLILRLIFTAHQDPSLVQSIGLEDDMPLIGYRSVAKNLELVADNAEDIATIVLERERDRFELTDATIGKIRNFADQVDEITMTANQSIIDRDFQLTTEVRRLFRDIGERERSLLVGLPEMSNQELLWVREVLVSLHETAQYAMRNAEIAANISLHDDSAHLTIRH